MSLYIRSLDNNSNTFLYTQLYERLKAEIVSGKIPPKSKLPSLRTLSLDLNISVTTVSAAYNQLMVEGYIICKPQSGYYVANVSLEKVPEGKEIDTYSFQSYSVEAPKYKYDLSSFDFIKWKKCVSKVFNNHSDLLLCESDPQGEKVLRHEVSKYLYNSRGVRCTPNQVIIGAGTQQLTRHLSRILKIMNINYISTEDPGYIKSETIFRDSGFFIKKIPMGKDGIEINQLPKNISSAVYVNPSNQFPTGAVMPIGRRYEILDWAKTNNSIILEDDYDSELRYFGKPVPALQGLDKTGHVVYFGSFSSTLFPAIKISYMVLPPKMTSIFSNINQDYDQTCSKAEQLTLAIFMEEGYYYTNIRRLRSLYANKLKKAISAFKKYGNNFAVPEDTHSGLNFILNVNSQKNSEELCDIAKSISIRVNPVFSDKGSTLHQLTFYYNQIPLDEIDVCINKLIHLWKS